MIEEVYRRIAAHRDNPVFIHVVPREQALEQARAAKGPLAGVPFAVKDNIDVAGMPTTAACPSFSYVPKNTAPAVQKLLDAGAVLVGKTNLDQFATGLAGTRSPYGACRNAFDPAYISGGSSSGSAVAVALGMASFALGTDTAGSGRVPAAFNNVVGLKPTPGRVSTEGVVPACRSLDCVSVLAKTCGEALDVLQQMQSVEDTHSFPRDVRFAVPKPLEFHGDERYAALFRKAVGRLGKVAEIDFAPFLEVQKLLYGPWVAERLADLEPYLDHMLPVTRQVIESGRKYSAADLFKAQHRLAELRTRCRGEFDVLVVPGAPTIYRIAEVEADPIELNSRLGRYTNFVNLLGLAAITVPAGFRPDGLPFGITLIGPGGSDAALAGLAGRFLGEGR
ncbi:MAG: allophanate hydrolase [Betaproteobacteria bacterium]